MKKLVIIGASGHGRVVADIAELCGYEDIVFLDDNPNLKNCLKYPVIGRSNDVPEDGDIFVAIGDNYTRKKVMNQYTNRYQPVLIHPSAVVANDTKIGNGTVVMANAVINTNATIGKGCIINTCSSVDHDCKIGDYVHVSVGAHIAGTVNIGNNTLVGAGATIINNIEICDDCILGAGVVVIKTIKNSGTYIGVPAKQIK